MTTNIPELPHHCNSWIVVRRETGEAVLETRNRKVVEAVNQEKHEVKTFLQYIVDLNTNIAASAKR